MQGARRRGAPNTEAATPFLAQTVPPPLCALASAHCGQQCNWGTQDEIAHRGDNHHGRHVLCTSPQSSTVEKNYKIVSCWRGRPDCCLCLWCDQFGDSNTYKLEMKHFLEFLQVNCWMSHCLSPARILYIAFYRTFSGWIVKMNTNPSLNPIHMLLIAAYMQEESERILTEWDGGRYKM